MLSTYNLLHLVYHYVISSYRLDKKSLTFCGKYETLLILMDVPTEATLEVKPTTNINRLNINQDTFARCYAKTGNATEAYLEAYPDCKNRLSARAHGSRLVANGKVKLAIDRYRSEYLESIWTKPMYTQTSLSRSSEIWKTASGVRYFEIAGKVLGYLQPDGVDVNIATFQIVRDELQKINMKSSVGNVSQCNTDVIQCNTINHATTDSVPLTPAANDLQKDSSLVVAQPIEKSSMEKNGQAGGEGPQTGGGSNG